MQCVYHAVAAGTLLQYNIIMTFSLGVFTPFFHVRRALHLFENIPKLRVFFFFSRANEVNDVELPPRRRRAVSVVYDETFSLINPRPQRYNQKLLISSSLSPVSKRGYFSLPSLSATSCTTTFRAVLIFYRKKKRVKKKRERISTKSTQAAALCTACTRFRNLNAVVADCII